MTEIHGLPTDLTGIAVGGAAIWNGEKFVAAPVSPYAPTVGEETQSRYGLVASTLTSETMRWAYFRARTTAEYAKIGVPVGTKAEATPTLIRFAVYAVGTEGALTEILASTVNNTALLAEANKESTEAFSAAFKAVAGTWYAAALLVVTSKVAPQIYVSSTAAILAAGDSRRPRLGGALGAQASLPAEVKVASMGETGIVPYFFIHS